MFFSKKFTSAQRDYSTVEKEALALVLSVQHFEVYLDHNPLTFLNLTMLWPMPYRGCGKPVGFSVFD